ncbi:MAG TPA: nucleotidyltransferase family protein, partial [Burkholderiales bacterium]|nr:nucleotidyltransferase family protein [Burkholderiales bacterium]
MSLSLPEIKSLLLDILFVDDVTAIPDTCDLEDEDWVTLAEMVREHRLGPLLHWRLTQECRLVFVPQTLRESCSKSFKAATMRSLALQRELAHLHAILQSSGIPHVALKGARLAFFAYPQPGLRPMRDLDILVPESDVLKAFDALMKGGCSRFDQYGGSPEAWIENSHQMPPVRSPSGVVGVELHQRLYHVDSEAASEFELSEEEGFWQRHIALDLAGAAIPYLSPTEQLLHLIVHAVYDHQFTNGPLLISDLGYLLR